jgi:uncharacterized protein involved in exopolysaccharide biosynthesis
MSDPEVRPGGTAHHSAVSVDNISVQQFVRIFRKNAWWILLVSFLASVIVGLWTVTRPRLYAARASLVPPLEMLDSKQALGRGMNSTLSQLLDRGGGITSLFRDVLQSQTVADVIIDQFRLTEVYKSSDLLKVRAKLRKRTSILVPRALGVVGVEVQDEDPNRAVAIANAYVEQLDKLNRSLLGGEAASKRVFLGSRLDEIQREFREIGDLKTREVQIKEMLFELLSREYELAKIDEAKTLPTIHVLDRATLPAEPVARGTVGKAGCAGTGVLVIMVLAVCLREDLF